MSESPWEYPKAILTTKYGTREIVVTEATHVHVSHDGYEGHLAKYLGPVRGAYYHASAHLYRWSDGTWHIGPHEGFGFNFEVLDSSKAKDAAQWDKRQSNSSSLYMTREGSFSTGAVTKAARAAIGSEIERAFNEWVKTDEAVEAFMSGQEKHLRRDLADKRKTAAETAEAYAKAQAIADEADAALADFLDAKRSTPTI